MRLKGFAGMVSAVALAVAVALLLPLQTYLGNAAIYPFFLVRLLPEAALIAFLLSVVLLLVQKILSSLTLNLQPQPLYAALLLCVYLESGILSLGIPELNGGIVPMLSDVSRGIADACTWGVIIIGFLACARWLRSFLHWISLAIFVLMIASLADVGHKTDIPSQPGASPCIVSGFEPQPTVVANVKYSSTRNILIFILDSMPGLGTAEALRTNAALKAKFPGFMAYPNNVGMHECTKRGVPGIVTGRHYDPTEMSEGEYPMTMYGTNSCVTAAVRAGWNVAFSPDLLPYGFINLPVEKHVARVEKLRSRDILAILRQSKVVPYLSLFDLTAFRLSPFLFKGPILYSRIRHAVKGRHSGDGFWGEGTMYPALATYPVSGDSKPFFGVFHSWGVHPPWSGDLKSALAEKLARLGVLMDAYRARNLYDKSTIVVTADHGLDLVQAPKGYPASASALLWIKPQGAAAPFAESAMLTSHARIAPLVKAALGRPLTGMECEAILRDGNPLYRAEVREGGREYFKEWRMK